jgi:hypothetical protein
VPSYHSQSPLTLIAVRLLHASQDFPNSRLLSFYGFALLDNRNDFIPIRLSAGAASGDAATARRKLELLQSLQLPLTQQLSIAGISPRLLNAVCACARASRW